jgi:5-methylcytosine-specific restriction endonuclease McrA
MGVAVWSSLKNKKSGKKWEHFVEYNLDQLIKHLEKKFDEKMNWDNYGSYWAVDHIKPKTLFAYASEKDEGFKQCWALENLQPLEKIQNIKKGNRYIG